jgi:hypothetical protein
MPNNLIKVFNVPSHNHQLSYRDSQHRPVFVSGSVESPASGRNAGSSNSGTVDGQALSSVRDDDVPASVAGCDDSISYAADDLVAPAATDRDAQFSIPDNDAPASAAGCDASFAAQDNVSSMASGNAETKQKYSFQTMQMRQFQLLSKP